ncbi:hypothetical protein DFH11DRAFT_1582986 [Phellopilus nigrolimitatus]|nr:hypothetical protein DFH11DRAFT_1582986 [Phellopilus nigrolimitatus]
MILLDEIDVKDKEKEKQRETLPPYSPRRILGPLDSQLSLTSTIRVQPSHPRSASVPSLGQGLLARSRSSFSLKNISSQTLVPPTPTLFSSGPSPSTSQLSLPLSPHALTVASLPAPRIGPPPHLRAANNVYVQRESAAITGAFVIDPTLFVPDCLLPDDPDVLLVGGGKNAKGKAKRANLILLTRSGDVCVDIWVRDGCATRGRRRTESRSKKRNEGRGGDNDSDTEGDDDYWGDGWTSPIPSYPWPRKTKSRAEIDIRSVSGSITVRIHSQMHQRLRIHLSSEQGAVSIGIPRSFMGHVHANAIANANVNMSASTTYLASQAISSSVNLHYDGEKEVPENGDASGEPVKQAPAITSRQPVQFSEEMESVVTAVSEHRKGARGQYFVGNNPNEVIYEHMGKPYFDELRIESRTGAIGVFFNDETSQQKPGGLITKLLNKANKAW